MPSSPATTLPGNWRPPARPRVQQDSDLAQPARQLVLDAACEGLCAAARAPEHLTHAAQGEAEMPYAARLGVRCRLCARGERAVARGIRREGDGERGLEDTQEKDRDCALTAP